MKRDVGIAYIAMRQIHYNLMRFRVTLRVDEAEGQPEELVQLVEDVTYCMIQKS